MNARGHLRWSLDTVLNWIHKGACCSVGMFSDVTKCLAVLHDSPKGHHLGLEGRMCLFLCINDSRQLIAGLLT